MLPIFSEQDVVKSLREYRSDKFLWWITKGAKYPKYHHGKYDIDVAVEGTRKAVFSGVEFDTAIIDYEKLMPTHKMVGPAIIEMKHSCCVVAPNWKMEVDEFKNLLLTK